MRVSGRPFWQPRGFVFNLEIVLVVLGGPQGGRVEQIVEQVLRSSFVGPPLGPPLEAKSANNVQKRSEKLVENIVRKVLPKMSLRSPSNPENYGFVNTKP